MGKLRQLAALIAGGQLASEDDDGGEDVDHDLPDIPDAAAGGAGVQKGFAAAVARAARAAAQEAASEPDDARVFYLLPEAVPAYRLFVDTFTQWYVGGMGTRTGINWPGVRACPSVQAIKSRRKREELLADLAVMERPYLARAAEVAEEERQHAKATGLGRSAPQRPRRLGR